MEASRRIKQCTDSKELVLDLSETGLTSIPDEVAQLTWLESLYLHNNPLSNIASFEFSSLRHLKNLKLGFTHVTKIPRAICDLELLKTLDLQGNNIRDIPSELFFLKNLEILNLSQNRIETIPEEIKNLASRKEDKEKGERATRGLSWLDLSQNAIKELPDGLFAISSLVTLDLHDNRIQLIPDEIGFLNNLSYLDLSFNDITSISHHISDLKSINDFRIHSNPVAVTIPREALGNANEKPPNSQILVDYFGDQLQEIREAKILLVGEGDVGKSSLIQRLINNRFREKNPKTDGIDVHKWRVKVQRDDGSFRSVRINIWDFGGQEIYHSTHRFFLTQRSLYLLVINSRRDFSNRIEYWLTTISNHVRDPQNAPVIIVANKFDENPSFSINITDLRRFYPNIVGLIRVSCLDPELGNGIKTLDRIIKREILRLNHVFDQIPASWLRAKEKLEGYANKHSVLSYDLYRNLCKSSGVDEDQIENLMPLFHDLGTVLNYYQPGSEHLQEEDTKVLDPNWVTQGVFSIIKKESPYIHNGILLRRNLKYLLDTKEYSTALHRTFIIDMMRKYELCTPFFEGDRYLIPDLLPEEEPEIDWNLEECLRFEYYYPDFLPQTIISKFIVGQHTFIMDKENPRFLWRTGCILQYDSNLALVRGEKGKKIAVFVSGTGDKRETLAIIRAEFAKIHSQFENLCYVEQVPISGHPSAAVEYNYLKASESEGVPKVYVEELKDWVFVQPLLNGIEEPQSKIELRRILIAKMGLDEFKNLLSDFLNGRYDYEDIEGEGKSNKIREFLNKLEREGNLDKLVEFLRNEPDYRYVLNH